MFQPFVYSNRFPALSSVLQDGDGQESDPFAWGILGPGNKSSFSRFKHSTLGGGLFYLFIYFFLPPLKPFQRLSNVSRRVWKRMKFNCVINDEFIKFYFQSYFGRNKKRSFSLRAKRFDGKTHYCFSAIQRKLDGHFRLRTRCWYRELFCIFY